MHLFKSKTSNLRRKSPATQWLLIVLFMIIALTSILLGIFYYKNQKKRLLNDKKTELQAIADLKVRQIDQWRQERASDGLFISANKPLIGLLSGYIKEQEPLPAKQEIVKILKSFTSSFDYKNIILLDSSGNVVLSYNNNDNAIDSELAEEISESAEFRKVILTDIYPADNPAYLRMNLLVPLINESDNDTTVAGVMVFRIDPREVLYPMVETWPLPAKTAEAFIIRQEGEQVVYLSNLRFQRNSSLQLRESVSDGKIPSALIAGGIESAVDAVDYRGKKVVTAMKKVPGVNWYLVAKVDHDEVLSELNEQITMVIIILVLFILTIGLLLGFIEWNENARFYREKYEKELDKLALRKHFDYILKYANDIIFLTDNNLMIIEANDRAAEIYQYDREELIGLPLSKIVDPGNTRKIIEEKKILDEKGFATFEAVHIRRDGTLFPVEVSSRKVEIEGVRYYQSICRDITERKQAEETLIESEERFRKIFEESPFPMAMTGKDLLILRANESFCRMTGYTEDELKTFTFRNFTHPDYISQYEVSLMKLVAREIPIYHTENQYIRKDSAVIWGSTTVSIIRNNLDEIQYFLFMIEDITLRKKAEIELIAAKEKAEESDRLKTAFLHNVSHEIRTPMNAIIGFSALLGEPDATPEERRQYIDIIFQSGGQLLSIINDIVDIANIESGQVKINPSRINLNSVLRSVDEQFSYQEKEGILSINLISELPDDEAVIVTDSTKLIQILSNLISNSIKFTREGRIDFGYVRKDNLFEFFVRDTGIGIPPEHHEKIFDRFYQVDKASSVKSSGTGLGLSICKAYVELLGGTIWLKSEPGKGTEFRFSIPSGIEKKDTAG